MAFIGKQLPIQLFFKIPLDELTKLLSHKQQLFARVCHHIAKQGAHPCKFLAVLARHLVDQRAFAVYHLIVGKWQDIVLRKSIHHAESQFIVVVGAVDWVQRNIAEHIVHPAHIPLEVKAQSAHIRRLGDQRPCGGFFGNHQHICMLAQNSRVELFQKLHRFQILVAAVDIRSPLPRFPAIIQIEHRSNGIYTQPIHMEFIHPEHRTGNQEALYLRSAKIKDTGPPVRMLPLLRVLIFITLGTVKLIQSLFILWKMCRYPVDDNTDIVFMELVDEIHQILRCSVARGCSKISGHLVSPGRVVRVFGNRHQFDVGVAHLLDINHHLIRHLAVIKKLSILILTPGAQVDLINIDWFPYMILQLAFFHPCLVLPGILAQLIKAGCRFRSGLHMISIGVRFQQNVACRCFNAVFVHIVLFDLRDEYLPQTVFADFFHRVIGSVPVIKIANDRNTQGMRSPHTEHRARNAFSL